MGCCDYPLCKYSRQETEEFLVHKSEQFSMADTNDDIGVHGAGTPEESADKMNLHLICLSILLLKQKWMIMSTIGQPPLLVLHGL